MLHYTCAFSDTLWVVALYHKCRRYLANEPTAPEWCAQVGFLSYLSLGRYQQLTYLVGTMRKPTISCYTGEVRLYTISMCRCCPHVQIAVLLERYCVTPCFPWARWTAFHTSVCGLVGLAGAGQWVGCGLGASPYLHQCRRFPGQRLPFHPSIATCSLNSHVHLYSQSLRFPCPTPLPLPMPR